MKRKLQKTVEMFYFKLLKEMSIFELYDFIMTG